MIYYLFYYIVEMFNWYVIYKYFVIIFIWNALLGVYELNLRIESMELSWVYVNSRVW